MIGGRPPVGLLDRLILAVDRGLRTVAVRATSGRPHPDRDVAEIELSEPDRRLAVSLMRVNHTGEVCAQALYQGQALTARDPKVQETLQEAAREETDHLAWTESRIDELGGRKSVFNPLFYVGSFALGAASGLAGDRWNLGFLAETERQVEGHLTDHLDRLPPADIKSRAVLEAMRTDEIKHAHTAVEGGAAALPQPIQVAMRLASKVMTGMTSRL